MSDLSQFSRSQAERFQRHFALQDFGIEAQAKLLGARVVVIGAGGLGAPILTYLAAAGVGTIDVIDHDEVDRSNLHRQVIHSEATLGQPKTASAAAAMRGLHPEIVIHEHREPLTAQNALELIGPADAVVDGSDNFATRYVAADACEIAGKPLISGSILRFQGQVSMFWSQPDFPDGPDAQRWPAGSRGPGYRDLYPEAPDAGEVPTCAEAGVLGVLPGVIGTLMATETVKLLAGIGQSLLGRVITYDALTSSFRELTLNPDPQREPVTTIGADVTGIGGGPAQASEAPEPAPAEAETSGQTHSSADAEPEDLDFNPFTGEPKRDDELTPRQLREAIAAGAVGGLVDVREPHEWAGGTIEGAVRMPLGDLARSGSVPGAEDAEADRPVVLYCAHGVRSRQAVDWFRQQNPDLPLANLMGGYELYRQAQ